MPFLTRLLYLKMRTSSGFREARLRLRLVNLEKARVLRCQLCRKHLNTIVTKAVRLGICDHVKRLKTRLCTSRIRQLRAASQDEDLVRDVGIY
jgi:hypothetical protein